MTHIWDFSITHRHLAETDLCKMGVIGLSVDFQRRENGIFEKFSEDIKFNFEQFESWGPKNKKFFIEDWR